MGVPPCQMKLLVSYLSGRTMEVHLSDAINDLFELWGGGPQGGLLTVRLFILNSNWITDVCQPGFPQSDRFSSLGPVAALRCSNAQTRDCPLMYQVSRFTCAVMKSNVLVALECLEERPS